MVQKQAEVCRNFELDWLACAQGEEETGRIDADYIVFRAKGDIEQLRKLVPAPLEATDEVIIYMGWFKETQKEGQTTWAWPFHEWGIGVVSRLTEPPYTEGNFLVQLYVDDDLVLVHGREVWGYPKKIGEMQITPKTTDGDSDHYEYTVSRRGTQLISARVENLQPADVSEFPFVDRQHAICFRQVPSPDKAAVDKQQLVFVQLDFQTEDVKKGTGTITINDGPFDQLPIGPLTDITAYFGRSAFNHRGINNLVVEAEELARPLDYSRAGKN
jgi:acetoacetate decarboxylase